MWWHRLSRRGLFKANSNGLLVFNCISFAIRLDRLKDFKVQVVLLIIPIGSASKLFAIPQIITAAIAGEPYLDAAGQARLRRVTIKTSEKNSLKLRVTHVAGYFPSRL